MRRWHLVSGLATVAAFLVSGAYLMLGVDLGSLAPGRRLLFISRHIYMLGPALVHLVLAVYLRPIPHARVVRLQWAGTIFLILTSVLLVASFVVEPMAGRGRTEVNAFGIFTSGPGPCCT